MSGAPYRRPPNTDLADAREFEQIVRGWLPAWVDDRTTSTSELDFYVPGFYIDVKEKKQRIGDRWPLPCREEDAFIVDELTIRKGLKHYPNAYFVIQDRPMGRVFVARIDEIAMTEKFRVNRVGKGKHIVDLMNFTHLLDPARDLMTYLVQDQISMPWKRSEILTRRDIPQV